MNALCSLLEKDAFVCVQYYFMRYRLPWQCRCLFFFILDSFGRRVSDHCRRLALAHADVDAQIHIQRTSSWHEYVHFAQFSSIIAIVTYYQYYLQHRTPARFCSHIFLKVCFIQQQQYADINIYSLLFLYFFFSELCE